MRTAKSHIALSVAALSIIMLLYSPLCSLSCALNSCAFTKAETAKPVEQPGHCHSSKEPKEQSSTPKQSPSAPSDDPGSCPAHVDAIAVLPSAVNANAGLHQDMQPVPAEPVSIAVFHLDLR